MMGGTSEDENDGDEEGEVHWNVGRDEDSQFQQKQFKFLVVLASIVSFCTWMVTGFLFLNEISLSFASIVFYLNLNK